MALLIVGIGLSCLVVSPPERNKTEGPVVKGKEETSSLEWARSLPAVDHQTDAAPGADMAEGMRTLKDPADSHGRSRPWSKDHGDLGEAARSKTEVSAPIGREQSAVNQTPTVDKPRDTTPYVPEIPPRPTECVDSESLLIKERVDLGFPFNPEQWPGRTLRLNNESKGPVAVSFHGEDVSHVRLNGQTVEVGKKYILDGEAEVHAERHVGIHLRSLDGSENQPAPDGPG